MGATYGQNDQFGAKTGLVAPNWCKTMGKTSQSKTKVMQWNNFTSQQWTLGGVWTSK